MVKRENKTIKMITTNEEEILEKLVAADHAFRKLNETVNFAEIVSPYYCLYSEIGSAGIDIFRCGRISPQRILPFHLNAV